MWEGAAPKPPPPHVHMSRHRVELRRRCAGACGARGVEGQPPGRTACKRAALRSVEALDPPARLF